MSRELRRVPPNWVHPLNEHGQKQPMFDRTFADAAREWKNEFLAWERGENKPDAEDLNAFSRGADTEYWEWADVPPTDRAYYRPWADEDATWWQLWESVTEGTPTTPPFATKAELIDHLATHGEDYDHKPWNRENAERFVLGSGWAPSAIIRTYADGSSTILTARDAPADR